MFRTKNPAIPVAFFSPVSPVCAGTPINLELNFTGVAPWSFDFFADGVFVTSVTTTDNPFFIPVIPNDTTVYSIQNLQDATGPGPDAELTVIVLPIPTAVMTLNGLDSVCAGSAAHFSIAVSNGVPPFSYVYSINGVNQPAQTATANPIKFETAALNVPAHIRLESLSASGCAGSVSGEDSVTIGPSFSAEIQTGKTFICNGQTEIIGVDFIGSGPFTFEYAVNGVAQGQINTSDQPYEISATPSADTTIYKLLYAEANGCQGSTFGADTLIIAPPPSAALSGNSTVCPGDSATLTINFTGNGPFLVQYTANTVAQTPLVVTQNPFLLKVGPTENTLYELSGVSANGCTGTVSGSALVMLSDSLKAVLSGGGQVCQGGAGADLTITFEGTGPYTFVYIATSGGVSDTMPAITTSQNPYSFNANPPVGTYYELLSVSNGTCNGFVSGLALVFVFTPSTAVLSGDQTFCNSANTNATIDFTGTGPFEITYTIDGLAQPSISTFDDPYLLAVSTNTTQKYVLTGVTSPGCTGNPSGSATITVNHPPGYSGFKSNCNPVSMDYVVEFDVINATPPLTLVSGSGSFSGNHFTSNPIPQGSPYSIDFHDANNCGDVMVSGAVNCSCQTDAGTMATLSPIVVCATDSAAAVYGNNFVNDGDDVLRFILHTTPALPLGNIVAWSQSPKFGLGGSIQTGITYYLSAIAGNSDGAGNVDLSDPCLSVAQGVPVTFYGLPNAVAGPDVTICEGKQTSVPVSLSGTPPYTLQWTLNGIPQSASNIPGGLYLLNFTAIDTMQVILTTVSDAHCTSSLQDTANVNILPIPRISNLVYQCDLQNGTYTLDFDCSGQSPLTVGGISGTFSGKHFTTVPVTVGNSYFITLEDINGCGRDTMTGTPFCGCITNAGYMDASPYILCYGFGVTTATAAGYTLEPEDTLVYVLLSPGFNPIAINDQPNFQFDPLTMYADSTYTIAIYAGDKLPGGGIDLNDPCLSISAGPAIHWRKEVTAVMSGDQTICPGAAAQILIDLGGNGPFDITYSANTIASSINFVVLDPYILNVMPPQNTLYTITSVLDATGCPGSVSGSADIQVDVQPQALQVQTICDLTNGTYRLMFEIGNGALPNPLYAVTGINGQLTDTTFISDPMPKNQPYNVTITNPTGCSTTITGMADCQCPTYAGGLDATALTVCLPDTLVQAVHNNQQSLDADDILRFVLCKDTSMLPQSIISVKNTPDFAFQPGMQAGVTYYIVAVAGSDDGAGNLNWGDFCLNISNRTPVTFYNAPTAVIGGDTSVCKGQNVVFKMHFSGQAPFKFVYAINGNPQTPITAPSLTFNISTNNIQQKQVFTIISVQDAHCPGTGSGTYTVNVTTPPAVSLQQDSSICLGDTALLRLVLSNADSFNLQIAGGPSPIAFNGVKNGELIPVNPTTTTTYSIVSATALGNNCPIGYGQAATISVIDFKATASLSTFGPYNLSCPGAADGAIDLSPVGGVLPLSAHWSNGETNQDLSDLTAGDYTVTLTDQTGCIYTEQFELTEPEPLDLDFRLVQPSCHDAVKEGSATIELVSGGVEPYTIMLNGNPVQPGQFPLTVDKLTPGMYTLDVEDANGCTTSGAFDITEPPVLSIDLGEDQTIYQGDSILLDPHVNDAGLLDSLIWTPVMFLNTPDELITYAKPAYTSAFTLWVQDTAGCTATDKILISVSKKKRVYLPTAIFPASENKSNQVFTVYGGPEVATVHFMRVFDRWGDLVFSNNNFLPNDLKSGWNGQVNGKEMNPGVFIFVLEVGYHDGTSEVFSGDVSVLR